MNKLIFYKDDEPNLVWAIVRIDNTFKMLQFIGDGVLNNSDIIIDSKLILSYE